MGSIDADAGIDQLVSETLIQERLRSGSFALRRAADLRDPRLRPWIGPPWRRLAGLVVHGGRVRCNICGWYGDRFEGVAHSESAKCFGCLSIARDRFLYQCWTRRVPYTASSRVLETSPRLGEDYRSRMGSLVDYVASDYDDRAHRAHIHLDFQQMDLPSESLDAILTAHVLEHVPDTDRALSEIYRVLKPGGVALVAVPVPQARTVSPSEPEYHGDRTLVYWRFGLDLTERFRSHGFSTVVLVTDDFIRRMKSQERWGVDAPEVHADDLLSAADTYLEDMVSVASDRESRWLGLEPSFYFVVWEARRPA
jgi:SAM-dependent methyltransferase